MWAGCGTVQSKHLIHSYVILSKVTLNDLRIKNYAQPPTLGLATKRRCVQQHRKLKVGSL